MAPFLCLLAAAIVLGPQLPSTASDALSQAEQPTHEGKDLQDLDDALNSLVNESIELTRSLAIDRKHGKAGTKEAHARLAELDQAIRRLHDLQTGELIAKDLLKVSQLEMAQVPRKAEADDQERPSDIYFQAWRLTRDAEKLKIAGKLAECREKLELAVKLFGSIAKEHPDWKPQMVQARLAKTKEDLSSLPPASE
jgi:hypothetical protein